MTTNLDCRSCGRTYESGPDEPWRCDCGHTLDFAERPLPDSDDPDVDPREGLWAFSEFLPVGREVTLGEGWTPLADAPHWDAEFKLDYVFPSGSFKDRGAALTLSRAAELGVERVVEDSSGNAGAAIAQYAARAGIDADIYVPADAKQSKLDAIEAAGATPVRVEGTRQDVTDACVREAVGGDAWYASHAWNPAFFAGTSTFALELAYQRDWDVPDAVVLPLGHGTLFLGASRGFRALRDAGWTDEVPRLLGVQASGVAPIVEELHRPERAGTNDVADGIQIREPARRDEILEAIEATGGDAIACDADTTGDALGALHERGFYVEPTSAVGVAGLEAYRERGELASDDDVVVALTGSGLKT
ncbi:threonine synthase [Halobacterium wangiae]|uniref:threonine synthase n=1 Tax=Halobacterium wangiae TaxID=2902623 RepID=UPI001E30E127|nr:threonine synthase [Halobacterium wangiae]